MTLHQDIDYKNNVFEEPELTHIQGEPTKSALLTIKNQIKANEQTVITSMDKGKCGHLGLLCD
eukprot:13787375-Ditylum_brightwellii.AAC.1